MKSVLTNRRGSVLIALLILIILIGSSIPTFAQESNGQPVPASIGADVPLTYFGPAPSNVQRELIGPYQLLKSGTIDLGHATITLPLYRGQMVSGEPVWYILTDTNDEGNAAALGLNFSAKLTYTEAGNAVRPAHLETDGSVTFERGKVDFAPEHSITPGVQPNPFPPAAFQPGSVGDEFYTPLAKIGDYVYNAPIVAFGVEADQIEFPDGNPDHRLVHDKVVAISPEAGTVTLALTAGFSFARPVLYLSTEANNPLAATMEGATLAPALSDVTVGRDDSAFSAIERIFAFANGPTGNDNPQRQGFNSALSGEGSPLNVLGGIPTVATDYSPLWDLNLGVWTQAAIDSDYRSRLTEEFAILGFAQQGWLTGPDGGAFGSTGIIVNCPIAWRFL
jgi:hypothetical protein